jgi:hypothetical protein
MIVQATLKADTQFISETMNEVFNHVEALLGTKGDEYSTDTNRFENFLAGASAENLPPERILWFMMLKHWLSLQKMIREISTPTRRPLDVWTEKIGDMETYLILLKAMATKRQQLESTIDQRNAPKLDGRNEAPNDERENPRDKYKRSIDLSKSTEYGDC